MTIQYLFNDDFISPYGGDYTIRVLDAPSYIRFTSTINGFTATKLLKGDSNPNAEYYKITIPASTSYRKVQVYGYSFRTNGDDKVLLLDLFQGGLDNFKTVKSGAWDDLNTWYIKDNSSSSVWQPATYTPNRFNSVFVESTHTVTLSKEESCLNLNYINAEDKTSVNTGAYNLNIYGVLRRYTGTAPGTDAAVGGGIGTAQWLVGTYVLKGKTRNLPSVGYPSSFNLYGSKFIVDLDANQSITILDLVGSVAYTLGGTFIVRSGSTFSTGNAQFRVAQTAATLAVADGDVIVESGGKMMTERLSPGGVVIGRGASIGFKSFNLNSGGIFESKSPAATVRIVAGTHNMNGAVYYSLAGAQNFLLGSASTPPGVTSITRYSEVYLTNTGVKTLVNNTTINNKLSINGTASLALGAFTLSYGIDADLEYKGTFTTGVEFVTNGSGVAIPRNLIVDGGVLTLNANKAIRGNIILLNGGNINYNGFSITLPSFRTVQSGNYESLNTWNVFNSFSTAGLATSIIPNSLHDIYVGANHTLTLNSDNSCKSLAINSTEDVVRLNLNNYTLNVNNQLDLYTGLATAPVYGAPAAPIGSTMLYNNGGNLGRIKFVGSGTRTLLQLGRVGANLRQAGLRIEIAATGTNTWQQYRLGNLIVSAGDTQTTLTTNVRLDTTGVSGQINGDLLIKTGAKFDGGIGITRLTGSTNLVNSVNIESGGELYFRNVTGTAVEMSVSTYSFLGRISYVAAGIQTTALSSNTGAVFLSSSTITNNELYFGGSGAKTLSNNQLINGKLILTGSASITLNSKTITFGDNGDLEIGTSRTKGSELPTNGSGVAIPRNLILGAGVVYNLGGAIVNIRGTLSLGAGASVTNGTLNQNQL